MRLALASAALLLDATQSAPSNHDWNLLFRDPGQGAVYVDMNSVWSRGSDRTITARFVFDDPRPGEVATLVTRIEMDCDAGTYRPRMATRYDRLGRTIDTMEFDENRRATRPSPSSPMIGLIARVCG